MRDFEAWAAGTSRIERVTHRGELERGKRILMELHAERWSAEGKNGVFDSAPFRAFHDAVMPRLLERGALDLGWITVRDRPVAAFYNIVWNGKSHFYQSGRRLDVPQSVRLGIVMHAFGIRHAIEAGLREYDFLGGASQYKMKMALDTRSLVTLRVARPSVVELARRSADVAIARMRALRTTLDAFRARGSA